MKKMKEKNIWNFKQIKEIQLISNHRVIYCLLLIKAEWVSVLTSKQFIDTHSVEMITESNFCFLCIALNKVRHPKPMDQISALATPRLLISICVRCVSRVSECVDDESFLSHSLLLIDYLHAGMYERASVVLKASDCWRERERVPLWMG